jgi:hypothetical protein
MAAWAKWHSENPPTNSIVDIPREFKIAELCKAMGDDCGGTSVDKEFLQIFDDVVGKDLIDQMKKEDVESYLEFLHNRLPLLCTTLQFYVLQVSHALLCLRYPLQLKKLCYSSF